MSSAIYSKTLRQNASPFICLLLLLPRRSRLGCTSMTLLLCPIHDIVLNPLLSPIGSWTWKPSKDGESLGVGVSAEPEHLLTKASYLARWCCWRSWFYGLETANRSWGLWWLVHSRPFSDTGMYFTHTLVSHWSAYRRTAYFSNFFDIYFTDSQLTCQRSCSPQGRLGMIQPAGLWRGFIYVTLIIRLLHVCLFQAFYFCGRAPMLFLLDMSLRWTEVGPANENICRHNARKNSIAPLTWKKRRRKKKNTNVCIASLLQMHLHIVPAIQFKACVGARNGTLTLCCVVVIDMASHFLMLVLQDTAGVWSTSKSKTHWLDLDRAMSICEWQFALPRNES
jgi:hypothetical protein